MGWRTYGEPEPEESPVGEFFIGLFLGAVGIPTQIGWVFVSLEWVTFSTMMTVCSGAGLLFGGKLAYDSAMRKKQRRKEQKDDGEQLPG